MGLSTFSLQTTNRLPVFTITENINVLHITYLVCKATNTCAISAMLLQLAEIIHQDEKQDRVGVNAE